MDKICRNKIINAETTYNDYSISPVIRQSLQHWGYQLTKEDFNKFKNKLKNENKNKLKNENKNKLKNENKK